MNIFYDIVESIRREYNKLTRKAKSIGQLTLSEAMSSSNYPVVKYRVKNSYVTVTDDDGTIANVFYDRISTAVLNALVTNQAGRTGFPLMSNAGLTIHSVLPSINRAYGLQIQPSEVLDGPFDPTTATSIMLTFQPGSLHFYDQGSVTFPIAGAYKLDNGVCIIKPTAYAHKPGVWDEVMASQTGTKTSLMLQTARTDYSPIAHILLQYQGMVWATDNRLINTVYPRNWELAAALKSVDGLPWTISGTDSDDFNLQNSWLLYNGSSRRLKGLMAYPNFVNLNDKLVQYAANLVDNDYDRVMVISGGLSGKMYTACALIHYNIG